MLECTSRITYDGVNVNNENLSSMSALRVVLPRQTRDVMSDRAKPDVLPVDATVESTAAFVMKALHTELCK